MSQPSAQPVKSPPAPRQQLSLLDSTCIIVGIIIGASIYEKSPDVARHSSTALLTMIARLREWSGADLLSVLSEEQVRLAAIVGIWSLGALFAFVGALTYAELATTYPEEGGSYAFLTRGLGKNVGFAFAWCEFWIIRPGNVGAIAYIFARYASRLTGEFAGSQTPMLLAALAIAAFSLTNLLGIRTGKWTQNFLTAIKVLGLVTIIVIGLVYSPPLEQSLPAKLPWDQGGISLALIFVMFAYGGWSDMSYVAAEVKDPSRNISRALLLGTLAVAVIYVGLNLALVRGLGSAKALSYAEAAPAQLLQMHFGAMGSAAISGLICISCLGSINGMIFTGARVFYALGADDRRFAWLGRWNERQGVPTRALVVQTAVTLALVIGFGLYKDGFDRLVIFTAPFFWSFFILVGIALFVLRFRDPKIVRVYRVPLFPLPTILFCLSSAFMVYSSVAFAISNRSLEAIWAGIVIVTGILVALLLPAGRKLTGP